MAIANIMHCSNVFDQVWEIWGKRHVDNILKVLHIHVCRSKDNSVIVYKLMFLCGMEVKSVLSIWICGLDGYIQVITHKGQSCL